LFKLIEFKNTFERALRTGINLFVGSGFSILSKDSEGRPLPTGGELANELATVFGMSSALKLAQIATILENQRKDDFYNYLRSRFDVRDFDERYKILDKIKIKTIFTTNIDNLIHKIFDQSSIYYLNDLTIRGPILDDKRAVNYVPLHGSVTNDNRPLVFTSSDIATTFNNDRDTWQYLRQSVLDTPTLFWGYSMEDSGVIQALFPSSNVNSQSKSKWITLLDEDEGTISYFRAMGFNIIIADTSGLLDYIGTVDFEMSGKGDYSHNNLVYKRFPNESIPTKSSLPVRPLIDFYHGAAPLWSDIFSGRIYKTKYFDVIVDKIYSGRHTIVLGTPASGKTTLMMQIASGIEYSGHKLVIGSITEERAKYIVRELNGEKALIFIDNFADDIEAIKILINRSNILLVLFEREHNFEIISHKIERGDFEICDVTELNAEDMQEIYNRIPPEIRKSPMQNLDAKQMSLFEFITLNIKAPNIAERFETLITELENPRLENLTELNKTNLIDFFVMCCYVHACGTPVSFDMAYSFLGDTIRNYNEVYEIRNQLGALIQEYMGDYIDEYQDYFVARSKIVSETILRQVPSSILKRVILRFHENVSVFRICRYDVFKKNAYDHRTMEKAFTDWREGKKFYEMAYERDSSPYLKQQGALYLASKRKFVDAFNWIDEAIQQTKNEVFSIRNSHAIILFEANINREDNDLTVRDTLDKSMSILSACYQHDRRKVYHAKIFAKQALKYFSKYGDDIGRNYLHTAYNWLLEEKVRSPWSQDVKKLLKDISQVMR